MKHTRTTVNNRRRRRGRSAQLPRPSSHRRRNGSQRRRTPRTNRRVPWRSVHFSSAADRLLRKVAAISAVDVAGPDILLALTGHPTVKNIFFKVHYTARLIPPYAWCTRRTRHTHLIPITNHPPSNLGHTPTHPGPSHQHLANTEVNAIRASRLPRLRGDPPLNMTTELVWYLI